MEIRMEKMTRKIKFEDALKDLKNIAYKVANKWGKEFSVDELVNEAWLANGNKGKEVDLLLLLRTARLDMIDYVRTRVGRKILKKKKPKYFTNVDCSADEGRYAHSDSFFDIHCCIVNEGIKEVDDKELVEYLLQATTPKQEQVLRKYFLEQKSLIEVGKELGNRDTRICNLKKMGLEKCREKFKEMDMVIQW